MVCLLTTLSLANIHSSAYSPQKGDAFKYSETITVNNGQGSYAGYTDQSQVTGMEQMNSVKDNSVSASYSFSYEYNNNQGSSTSNSTSGNYEWSSSNFTYVNGTDNQLGYSLPTYVWFAMNPALPVGGTFYVLNTQFTVTSKNYSFQLPTENNRYVQTIQTEGTGEFQRNDSYGVFNASYTWDAFYDPSTGYIVGYKYVEQDSGEYQGQVGSFTYIDNLSVTSTSYALAGASPAIGSTTATNTQSNVVSFAPFLGYIITGIVLLALVIAISVYAATRRKKGNTLPEHPYPPYSPGPPPSSPPWDSKIDLGAQPPAQQVVIRDVAKVNCKYCGTLIPSTADTCPYCGAPRQ